jgi:hypothetical protein
VCGALCPASSSRGGLPGLAGVTTPGTPAVGYHQLSRGCSTYTTRPAGYPSGGVPPAVERQLRLLTVVRLGGGAQQNGKQPKAKGKGKGGGGGAGGGPSNKAAAAGSSSGEASTSRGEGSRPTTLPAGGAGLHTTMEDAVQPALPCAEAASGAQQTEPQPAGNSKKEKERQRKQRQKLRKMEEAMEALQ